MTILPSMFPTFVVGSLPRPQWVQELIEDRKSRRIDECSSSQILDDTIPSVIRMQERAGLDFVSDGEWRRESYVKVFSDAVNGFENDLIYDGTAISKIGYPAVVSELNLQRGIATNEAEFLVNNTSFNTLVALPSPYTIARRMWSPDHSGKIYPTREDFMDACIPIIRDEIQQLINIGVTAIQLDDPWLALLVDPAYRDRENIINLDHEMRQSIKGINESVINAPKDIISVHLCHAHFNRKHGTTGSYALIFEALHQMNVNRFAIEFATPDAGGIDVLRKFPKDKVLGLGVIDHTDPIVETSSVVIERTMAAMEFIQPNQITLNPDCGFAPSSANPMDLDEAYLKLAVMCEAANKLREDYA